MKKLIFLILISILALNCEFVSIHYSPVMCMEDYKFEENIEIKTFEDCFRWTLLNITYVPEALKETDSIQTPEETYNLRTGDNRDRCLMTQYLLYTKLGINSELSNTFLVYVEAFHYVIKIENDYYESISATTINHFYEEGRNIHVCGIEYCEEIGQAVTYHRLLEESCK